MMQLHNISTPFRDLLVQSGWSVDRCIKISDWVNILEREGFKPNSLALAILESLWGLSVKLPPAGINPYELEIRFDPVRAATGEFDRIEEWQEALGINLFPLGEEVRNGSIVWAGSDGRVYYGREFGLYILGDSFATGMDQLAFPKTPYILCAD